MLTHPLKLVTIIAEPVLEIHITQELRGLGAAGFTVIECRGQGSRGLHATELPDVKIRIESIVSSVVAERIVEHIASHYFGDYSLIAFTSDVAVVRGEKYMTLTPEHA